MNTTHRGIGARRGILRGTALEGHEGISLYRECTVCALDCTNEGHEESEQNHKPIRELVELVIANLLAQLTKS
jgi:hypothetical protein